MTEEQLAVDREFVRQQRELLARIDRPFPIWCMASTSAKDITARSHQMKRDSCILYPNKTPHGDDPADFRGLMRDSDGRDWWLGCWLRIVKGQRVLEIRRVLKTN
jgi:hypothetical protein